MSNQVFRWQERTYDITRLLADLSTGQLGPSLVDLSAAFVALYAQMFLVRSEGPAPLFIDTWHALTKTASPSPDPIVLLHVGIDQGLITLEEDRKNHNWVVGDGNHRLLAAALHQMAVRAYLLSEAESALYEIAEEEGR